MIKDRNKNIQDTDIIYIGINAYYTLYWTMPIMVSYLTIIQLLVRIHLRMLDFTLDDDDKIDDKYDEITNDEIIHIDDVYNLIVFNDETIHEVKIVFYDTSSSENVTATDIDVDYQLGVLDAGISSIHAPHKYPDEANITAEEASKEIDIDAFINDMNRFLLSTELHITSSMLYETPSDEIEGFNNDGAANGSNIDTHIKLFLSEATKEDPTKDTSTTTFLYNEEYLLNSTDVYCHNPYPDEIGTEWKASDKYSYCSIGIPKHVSATTALVLKFCYLVGN